MSAWCVSSVCLSVIHSLPLSLFLPQTNSHSLSLTLKQAMESLNSFLTGPEAFHRASMELIALTATNTAVMDRVAAAAHDAAGGG